MNARELVDAIFTRLATGTLAADTPLEQSGWQATLPNGRVVTRSALQHEAVPLIALRGDAVTHLQRWAEHDNEALRYVAKYALEQIAGACSDA